MTNEFSWEEMRAVVHAVKEERVVICGALLRLKESDEKLKRVEDNLMNLIDKHNEEDINGKEKA